MATEPLPIDATRGMRDFDDELAALLEIEGLERPAFVAHSAGAGVVMQFAIDHPDRVGPLVLEAPMSPYGFGGTKDLDGTPCWPDHAGSGGGTANPDFVAGIAAETVAPTTRPRPATSYAPSTSRPATASRTRRSCSTRC